MGVGNKMTQPISSKDEHQRMRLYLMLMDEARIRFDVINCALRNEAGYSPRVVREICYLQLRVLCELVAMGCLVAHGNISKSFSKIYEASKIINQMQKLNEHFYPHPASIAREGNRVKLNAKAERSHLTRQDLVRLWGEAGSALHISPLSKHTSPRKSKPDDLADVITWSHKLVGLLNTHLIQLSDTVGLLVSLKNVETGKPIATRLTFSLETDEVNVEHFRGV